MHPLDTPFDIPESWEWVRLIDVCEYIQRGKSPKYSPIKKYPVVAQKCNQWSGFSIEKAQFIEPDSLSSYGPERLLQDNDLMWNSTGLGTLGRMAIYKTAANPYELAVADSHVTVIRPLKQFVLPEYLYYYFANPSVQSVIEDQADGTTKQKELATATIKAYLTPIPPLDEQRRILTKLSEVLPVVKSYGAVYGETVAMQEAFPEALKKSILQEAVQGKLVPQNPSDEPAGTLLERIRAEKQRLIKEGKIKKDKHESVIFRRDNSHYEKRGSEEVCIDDELPFDIPSTWMWSRLSSIVTVLGDGIHGTPVYSANGTTAFINGNNLQDGKIVIKPDTKRVTDEEASKHKRCLTKDTVLLSINGTIGNVAFYDGEHVILGKSACYFNLLIGVSKEYVRLVLETDYFAKYAVSVATGTTIKNVPLAGMRNLLVPIPPTAEQAEIVQAVALALNLVAAL